MTIPVHRYRTAMVRHTLSQPMSLAVRHGIVRPGVTVFDYGCGKGDDLRALKAAGVEAGGWDPHFAPDQLPQEADVVNLGFVLNVIENEAERTEALRKAWDLTRRVLVASAMLVGAVPVNGSKPFGDGYLTARGTFQKYFQQAELKGFLEKWTSVEPVALAPGIFALFRFPEDEQEFLLERRRGRRASTSGYRSGRRERSNAPRPELAVRIADVIDAIVALALLRGRLPHTDEVPTRIHERLATERVSFTRALDASRATIDDEIWARAEARGHDDILVHQALNTLNRSGSASRPSPAMIRDIRYHFGSHQQLAEHAMEYLRALADPLRTAESAQRSAALGLGAIDEDGRLLIDGARLTEVEGILRCYVGCAVYLSGELDEDHIVRLDPLRRRVTLFPLTGRRTPFPETMKSINIDLKRQDVTVMEERRVLIRKADVFGMALRSRQRSLEAERRAMVEADEAKALIRI